MKIIDLIDSEENFELAKLLIRLTSKMKEAYENYCSKGEEEAYLVGEVMNDWFISPDPPGKEKRTLYPLPMEVEISDFLECEIIKNYTNEEV